MLQARVEEVIKDFNQEMEASEERMERFRTTVMNSAKEVIAKLEEAEARRKEELGKKMNELIEKLTSDLGVIILLPKLHIMIWNTGDGTAGRRVEAVLFWACTLSEGFPNEIINTPEELYFFFSMFTIEPRFPQY